ncbi:hypothetical protein ACFFVB_02500 [Formosa undariae]|uniref:T9SS type A sorting domain-containing protein n=1 Tax=Formosa undariae TaxID=1325436 RepID=A0ABV5EXM6_9FLAO
MKKITSFLLNNIISKQILAIVLLFAVTSGFAQTVTDVFPTRVTYQTKVTIKGAGFTSGMENNISITNSDISVTSKTWVSATEMTFVISRSEQTTGQSTSKDITGDLKLNSTDTGFNISYIAPNYKILRHENIENSVIKITEIFTNWDYNGNGYWRSSWYNSSSSTWPNNRHELLAFTFDGITYSTGVDDDLLSTIPGLTFTPQNFKAYSTNGIDGNSHSGNFMATGDLVDGEVSEGTTITSDFIKGLTVYDVITDGENGLDLGTGITNFNQTTSVKFFSGNGQVGAVDDNVPDLIISQIAQPGGDNFYDVYYYADEEGNVVGRPVKLVMLDQKTNGAGLLAKWRLDLYSMTDGSYTTSSPLINALGSDADRPLRMVAFKLQDFSISSDSTDVYNYVKNVNNINLMAGGSCDIAFLAYNKSAFDIKAPVADALLPRYVCRLPSTTDITFSVSAGVDGGGTGSSSETLTYEWSKYNELPSGSGPSLTIDNVEEDDLATYNVRIFNDFGSIIVPVTLEQGGTPTAWDGTSWSVPSAYSNAEITISPEDKSLIFYDDYNSDSNLEGCDCTVKAGTNVVIPSGQTLKLYNNLTVEPTEDVYDDSGDFVESVPAGTFTLENNASLIQINDNVNYVNTGDIKVERLAENIKHYDYVYWSSPVEGFNVSNIPTSRTFKWDPTSVNANGSTGDWISVSSEIMVPGSGYIARVPNATSFTNTFTGIPNTGEITIPVKKSTGTLPPEGDEDFNLIGNPYPSAININKFLEENKNLLDGFVKIWTHKEGISNTADNSFYENFVYNYEDSYLTYNSTGSNPDLDGFQGNIASGQSFFVKLKETSGNGEVNFLNNMRYDNSENQYNNNEFFRGTAVSSEEKQLLWLNLVNEKKLSQSTLVGYVDGATTERDRLYDAQADGDDFKIYSLISDEKMVIQGRPLPFSDADEVPLGIQVATNGSYQIGIDNLKGSLFENEGQDIYLEDTYLNMEHDLRQSPYSFTATAGAINDRFVLKYLASTTLSVGEEVSNNTYVYINDATLYVKTAKIIKAIEIYDFSGKRIEAYKGLINSSEFSSPFPFSNGGYIVSITMEDGRVVNKKLIN